MENKSTKTKEKRSQKKPGVSTWVGTNYCNANARSQVSFESQTCFANISMYYWLPAFSEVLGLMCAHVIFRW